MKYLEAESDHMIQSGDFPTSLIMADCNYLKRTNDTLGHEYGDLLLQRTSGNIIFVLVIPEKVCYNNNKVENKRQKAA